jgi:hypothetical protein
MENLNEEVNKKLMEEIAKLDNRFKLQMNSLKDAVMNNLSFTLKDLSSLADKSFTRNSSEINEYLNLTKDIFKPKIDFEQFQQNFQKNFPTKEFQLSYEIFIKNIRDMADYVKEHRSAQTQINDHFDYTISFNESKFPEISNTFKNLNLLKSRLELKKNNNYKNKNILMVHDFISNLNDCFIYLNNSLINLRIKEKTFTTLLFGVDKKSKDGRDGVANKVTKFLRWILTLETNLEKRNKIKEIINYFNAFEILIRNYYSHGWLDIFPLLALDIKGKREPLFYLSYDIQIKTNKKGEKEEEFNLKLNIWDAEEFIDEIEFLDKDGEITESIKLNCNILEQLVLSQEASRPLLRKLSTNEKYTNIEVENYPRNIIIYSDQDEKNDISICEESFVEKVNELISIIDDLVTNGKISLEKL